MTGLTDLQTLLTHLQPSLADEPYAFVTDAAQPEAYDRAFAIVREREATTLIVAVKHLADSTRQHYARITLEVHSSLAAVGLTAAVSRALADVGIPANVIAGYYHDHIFVPYEHRGEALAAIRRLAVTKVS